MDMFDRLISLIGENSFGKIKHTNILILGIGGVGGYVVESLVRSGIHNLTIVDKDIIDITNLNRQIIALNSNIGKNKVDECAKRCIDINPEIKIKSIKKELTEDNLQELNLENYDYVIDCIDDFKTKLSLIKYLIDNNIKFVSSTGTAKKMHPEMLKITTLAKTEYDPLARKLRQNLKRYNQNKITVLASIEKPIETESNSLGSAMFVPATGGILIASHVINEIIR